MPRLPRAFTLVAVLAAGLVAVAGCGSDASSSPSSEAQTLAQSGLLQSYTATYALTGATGAPSGTVTVWRTPRNLRLDVTTAAGVSTSITTPEGTVACQKQATGGAATCLKVAGPAKTPPANFDPVLRKVFGDVLRVLAAGGNGIEITSTQPTVASSAASAAPVPTPSGIEDVRCFAAKSPTGSIVSTGTYCFDANGVPVQLTFASGSAVLTSFTPGAPAATTFAPLASPTPLPSAAS